MKNMLKGLAAAALVFAVITPVSAASFDLSFNTQNTGARNSLTYSYNDGLDSLTVTGLSARNGRQITSSSVQTWNGWGMGMQTSGGSHRISNDSVNGHRVYQMVLLDFGREVSLDSFTVGDSVWGNNNWASVLAYTDSAPLNTLNGLTWSNLLQNGFSHAGNANTYTGVAQGTPKLIEGGLTSQYWLVGVYNAVFSNNPLLTYNEGFKLTGISFSTMDVSEVPLPAAAWLFLTGLAGMTWMKKRKQKRDLLQAA